ncbi:MAG: phospho-N-acetylmuramoyl-pentapeptide-transferase [Patescibacteria group bacterium]|nr:phospho-N-acetylmuramoyl-pentapeptide-transferase [Patescibacteria group bacterium]
MINFLQTTGDLANIIGFIVFSALFAFAWAPLLTAILYRFHIAKAPKYELAGMENRASKNGTPIMGGLLVIITVALFTYLFDWSRAYTWVPVGVMLLSAFLGGIDDIMNIYGHERRSRKLGQVITLIRVHREFRMRLWYALTLPWTAFKRLSAWLGSRPGKGVLVHEKLIFQFIAGATAAWWIYSKLGPAWHYLYLPFGPDVYLGPWLIPAIIFIVMFTANAVNIADGMDGLAGGMGIITFSALTLLSWTNGFGEIAIMNAITVGALVAYTYFNIKPARFMMGDVGSLGLGALLAVNTLAIGEISSIFFLGFMFYIEALTVVIQVFGRAFFGRRIFKMAPLHHHFELSGWSEEKTIMRFWIIHFIFVVLGVWLALH